MIRYLLDTKINWLPILSHNRVGAPREFTLTQARNVLRGDFFFSS